MAYMPPPKAGYGIGESGTIATLELPREKEFGQQLTKRDVDVLAKYKASRIGYSGKVRWRVR